MSADETSRVERLDLTGEPAAWHAWDQFVLAHSRAMFPYLSGHLRAMAASSRYAIWGLVLRRGVSIRAVLPLFRARRRTISVPVYEYGGPLVAADCTADEMAALLAAAGPVEMRVAHGWSGPVELVRRQVINPFGTLPLHADPEQVLAGCDRQVRKAVRKAEREGVEVRQDNSETALREVWWPRYLRWMRDRHGTPPQSLAYWLACRQHLEPYWHLFQAWHEGRPAAQLLGFGVGRRVSITVIVSDSDDWGARVVDAVHWGFVKWACEHGYEWFDFGSARYEGQRRYKEKWGCQFGTYELVTYPASLDAHLPAPEDPVAKLARRVWRKLPLGVTATLGPPLREWLTL